MDFSLMDDLNHFFDVFNTRTENSLKKNLPPEFGRYCVQGCFGGSKITS